MSSSQDGGGLRAWQLALRNNRNKPQFFQAGGKQEKQKVKTGEQNSSLLKKHKGTKRKRGRPSQSTAADGVQPKHPSPPKRPCSASSAGPKRSEKRCRAELMVIEEGDDVPEEHEPLLGHVVWAPFGSFHGYHPALVIKGSMVNLTTADSSLAFVFWFSDGKVSAVPRGKLLKFIPFFKERGTLSSGKRGQHGVIKAIEELQRCTAARIPSILDMDPLQWAQLGFPAENKSHIQPGPDFQFPESVLERLATIGAEIRQKALQKDRDIPNEFHNESAILAVWQGTKSITDVCIGCADCDRKMACQHPLFEGGLCAKCKEVLQEAFYAVGDDGTHSYCAICGAGGQLFVCDTPNCGRVYCVPCVEELGGEDVLRKVKEAKKWACFLCQPFKASTHGLLKSHPHWQENIILFFDVGHRTTLVPDLEYFKVRRPIRVLSLFDGIGTGLLALQRAGLSVEVYYASETDEQAAIISQANLGGLITQLGDVTTITKERLAEIAPIDLLIGGSPCNELSLANPLRKGFDVEGSGVLFFDFYRILRDLVALNGETHLFWMFENVASMRTVYRTVISRFLQCQPAVWDAKHLSAQKRSRFFWGNIPGLYSTPEVSDGLRQEADLNSVLTKQCHRQATVQHVRTITTNSNSLLQGVGRSALPVSMAGAMDTLWLSELERLFGFPAHYTDVSNLPPTKRRALLGKSWSVQVVTEIFRPLTQYFATVSAEKPSSEKAPPVTSAKKELHVDDTQFTAMDGTTPAPSVSNAWDVSSTDKASGGIIQNVDDLDRDVKLFSSVDTKSTKNKSSEIPVADSKDNICSCEKDITNRRDAAVSSTKSKGLDVFVAGCKGTNMSVASFAADVSVTHTEKTDVSPADKKTDIPVVDIKDAEVASVQVKDSDESDGNMKDTDGTVVEKGECALSADSEDAELPVDDTKKTTNSPVSGASEVICSPVDSTITDACTSGGDTASNISAINDETASATSVGKDRNSSEDKANKGFQSKSDTAVAMTTNPSASSASGNGIAASIVGDESDTCGNTENMVSATNRIRESRSPFHMDAVTSDRPCGDLAANIPIASQHAENLSPGDNTFKASITEVCQGTDTDMTSDSSAKDADQPGTDMEVRTQARCSTHGDLQNVTSTEVACQDLRPSSLEGKRDGCTSTKSSEIIEVHIAKNVQEWIMGNVHLKDADPNVDVSYQAGECELQTDDDVDGIHFMDCCNHNVMYEDLDGTDQILCSSDTIIVVEDVCDSSGVTVENSSESLPLTHVDVLVDHGYHSTSSTQEQGHASAPETKQYYSHGSTPQEQMEIMDHFPILAEVTETFPQNVDCSQSVEGQEDLFTVWVHDKSGKQINVAEMARVDQDSHPQDSLPECVHSGQTDSHRYLFCAEELVEDESDCSAETEKQIRNSTEASKETNSTEASTRNESQVMNCAYASSSGQGKYPNPVPGCAEETSNDDVPESTELKTDSIVLQHAGYSQQPISTKKATGEGSSSSSYPQSQSSFLVPSGPTDGSLVDDTLSSNHTTNETDQFSAGGYESDLCQPHVPKDVLISLPLIEDLGNTECKERMESIIDHLSDMGNITLQQTEGREMVKHLSSEQFMTQQEQQQISNSEIHSDSFSSAQESSKLNVEGKQVKQISSECQHEKMRTERETENLPLQNPSERQNCSKDVKNNTSGQNLRSTAAKQRASITKKYQIRVASRKQPGMQKSAHEQCSTRKIPDEKTKVILRPKTGRKKQCSRTNSSSDDTVHITSSLSLLDISKTVVDGSVITSVDAGDTATINRLPTAREISALPVIAQTVADEKLGIQDPNRLPALSCQVRSRSAEKDGRKVACVVFNRSNSAKRHNSEMSLLLKDTSKGTMPVSETKLHCHKTGLYLSSTKSSGPTAGFSGNFRQQTSRFQQDQAASVCQQATSTCGMGQKQQQRSAPFHHLRNNPDPARMVNSQLSEQRTLTSRQSLHEESKRSGSKRHSEEGKRSSKQCFEAKGYSDTSLHTQKRARAHRDLTQQQACSSAGGPAQISATHLDHCESRPHSSDTDCKPHVQHRRSHRLSARCSQSKV